MNAVVMGTALAAADLGWEVFGIEDGFGALLEPERYADDGIVPLQALDLVESLEPAAGGVLGQSRKVDPFHVRHVDADNMVEELDMSEPLLQALQDKGIDSLISVVGGRGLSIMLKLHRKGLNVACIPRSIENDIATTSVSFGFNSALSFSIDMVDRARQAAQAASRIGVVEVLGDQAGWIALQAAIAVCADAVLIPEIPCDLSYVATRFEEEG